MANQKQQNAAANRYYPVFRQAPDEVKDAFKTAYDQIYRLSDQNEQLRQTNADLLARIVVLEAKP